MRTSTGMYKCRNTESTPEKKTMIKVFHNYVWQEDFFTMTWFYTFIQEELVTPDTILFIQYTTWLKLPLVLHTHAVRQRNKANPVWPHFMADNPFSYAALPRTSQIWYHNGEWTDAEKVGIILYFTFIFWKLLITHLWKLISGWMFPKSKWLKMEP